MTMPAPTATPSTASRARRYRERQKRGMFMVNVPVKASGIKLMIEAGWLTPDQGGNRDAVAKAVIRAANIGFAMPRGERHALRAFRHSVHLQN
jgi:hypothetical protein